VRSLSLYCNREDESRGPGMEITEDPKENHPVQTTYRHISVKEIDGAPLLQFVDLRNELQTPGFFQETCQEFGMLASHHQNCSVTVDLEGQEVSASELFICYLVRLDREIKQVQGTLKLCNISPLFAEAMRVIRLDRMFSIYESLDDALISDPSTPER
jgi:anti-anti-sigma regulatory factor